ncbi:site-specific integrase, partial [Cobetia marina]
MFYPTLFTTVRLRNAGAAVNTIRNKLGDILVLLLWEAHNRRDLIAEFSQSRFLSLPDVLSLRDFMKRDTRDLKPMKPRRGAASIHAFLEAHVGRSGTHASVCASHHFNRMTTLAEYLEFLATVLTQHKQSNDDADAIKKMATSIRNHRPRGLMGYSDGDPHDKSPPSELIDRFMAVSAVDHPHNPFRDPGVRLRNAILFGLLRHTGMRRGELLSVRTDLFEFGNEPLVWLRRNQDDINDPRPYQGVPKTNERALPLP